MRYVPVEEARKQLGKLVQEAVAGTVITIGRRGSEQAVLLSGEEYERLRQVEEESAKVRFQAALETIGAAVAEHELSPDLVTEAIHATRHAENTEKTV